MKGENATWTTPHAWGRSRALRRPLLLPMIQS